MSLRSCAIENHAEFQGHRYQLPPIGRWVPTACDKILDNPDLTVGMNNGRVAKRKICTDSEKVTGKLNLIVVAWSFGNWRQTLRGIRFNYWLTKSKLIFTPKSDSFRQKEDKPFKHVKLWSRVVGAHIRLGYSLLGNWETNHHYARLTGRVCPCFRPALATTSTGRNSQPSWRIWGLCWPHRFLMGGRIFSDWTCDQISN